MTSFQCSTLINDLNPFEPRRSDRKRTKKIYKDDFMLPNPFKQKFKKQKGLRLPQNLGSQIRKIQFLTERTLLTLHYGEQQFSIQTLKEMKQAANQQQIKLSKFLSIKLTGQNNVQQNRIHQNLLKIQELTIEKGNTPKIQETTITGEHYQTQQIQKQFMGMVTVEELYQQYYLENEIQGESKISAFQEQKDSSLSEAPRFRKESSKLLSDNYQKNELMYTIEHMIPNWHGQEIELDSEREFID